MIRFGVWLGFFLLFEEIWVLDEEGFVMVLKIFGLLMLRVVFVFCKMKVVVVMSFKKRWWLIIL